MSNGNEPKTGAITWTDLTVTDAERIRDFYSNVAGWKFEPVDMGGYSDYNMIGSDGKPVAGICHARGGNAGLPPQWLIYITVSDVETSARQCRKNGGKVLVGPKKLGLHGSYCVVQDPAGAVAALFQPASK